MKLREYVSTELRKLRAGKNISLKEVANALKMDVGTLSRYENNKNDITLETLEKILDYYNVTLKEFFDCF